MTTLYLYDSTDARQIPRDAQAVAGYGDGLYNWSPSWADGSNWWDLFPAAAQLVIVVRPGDVGDVADVERLDFAPADAPGFVRAFNRPGRRRPSLYCNRANWPLVVDALRRDGLDPAAIDWWIATLDRTLNVWYGQAGTPPPPELHVVAVQVDDPGPYDVSLVLDPSWVGVGVDMATVQLDPQDPAYRALMDKIEAGPYGLAEGASPPPNQHEALDILRGLNDYFGRIKPIERMQAQEDAIKAELNATQAILTTLQQTMQAILQQGGPPPASLQPIANMVADLTTSVTRLSAHLGL